MKRTAWAMALGLLAGAVSQTGQAQSARSPAQAGFERLSLMVGDWDFRDTLIRGEASRPASVTGGVRYELVSNGTVLQERVDGPDHGTAHMVSMIWVDGDRLVLDHYCSSGTRPRLVSRGLVAHELRFVHEGHTGVSSESTGHIHAAVFRFDTAGRFTSEWTWQEPGVTHTAERHHRRARRDEAR